MDLRPKGAQGESLGQRPRSGNNEMAPALKGRNPPTVRAFILRAHGHFQHLIKQQAASNERHG